MSLQDGLNRSMFLAHRPPFSMSERRFGKHGRPPHGRPDVTQR
jgi:hypothetical protein